MRMARYSLIGSVAVGLAVSGCGGEDEVRLGDGKLTIAMIGKSSANPVFLSAREGAEAAARDFSQQYGVPIEINWLTPEQEDPQAQARHVTEAAGSQVDAILISASDADAVREPINAAVQNGVQVMTFDSDVPNSGRFAFYGFDDVQIGRHVMAELSKAIGGQGKVAVLAGNPDAPNLQQRVQGVREEAAKHPGIQIVGVFHHPETADSSTAEVLRVTQQHPDLAGWAMVGGWPLTEPTLLNQLDPQRTKIVAVGGLPSQLQYVESGLTPVLLAQPTYMWGYTGVQTIVDKLVNERKVPENIPMAPVPVIPQNLSYWANQLQDWGFKDVPQKYLSQ